MWRSSTMRRCLAVLADAAQRERAAAGTPTTTARAASASTLAAPPPPPPRPLAASARPFSAFSDQRAYSQPEEHSNVGNDDEAPNSTTTTTTSTNDVPTATVDGGPWVDADDAAGAARAAATRRALLDAALAAVPKNGWTAAALAEGACSLGLSPAVAGLLPRREASLVEHYARGLNARLAEELASPEERRALRALPARSARVARALRRRLEMQREFLDTWPQALGVLAAAAPQPGGAAAALGLLAEVADLAVRAAEAAEEEEAGEGEAAATPPSSSSSSSSAAAWYGQRAAAAAAYAASELYMQTDCSPGFADTWEQMHRRLADAEAVSGLAEAAGGAVEGVAGAVARLLGLSPSSSSSFSER
jgi:ubiquinone biosynthesis protein COQ9